MGFDPHSDQETVYILVADSSVVHTQLLADALNRNRGLIATAAPPDPGGLIATASRQHFDVVVLSSSLDEQPGWGFEVLRELRTSQPDLRAIVRLDSSRKEAILEAFRAGARGIFSRHESVEVLCKCIRSVHQGQVWANSRQVEMAIEALSSAPSVRPLRANGLALLSKRELQVVNSLAEGLTNREIAERLGLSQHTVKNYLFKVFEKLGVSGRIELLFLTLSQTSPGKHSSGDSGEVGLAYNLQAAKKGLATAPITLAEMYSSGRGVPIDIISAYMWYVIASNLLMNARNNLTKAMTMEQLLKAEKRAEDWLAERKTNGHESTSDHAHSGPTILPEASSA